MCTVGRLFDQGADEPPTARDDIDCNGKLVGSSTLDDVSDRTGFEGSVDKAGTLVRRHDDDAQCCRLPMNSLGRFEPIHLGHRHIHQDDVGMQSESEIDAFLTVRSLAHDNDAYHRRQ